MPAIPFSRRFRAAVSAVHADAAAHVLLFRSRSAPASPTPAGRWSAAPGAVPSADALEDYEPRQTSKLYAADGRYITELGLERRTLVKIADIPPLVRQRVRRHRGQALLPARRHRLGERAARRGRRPQEPQLQRRLLDDHDAARAQHLPRAALARQDAHSQAERSEGRARDRGEVLEGQDPRALSQPDQLRQRRLRHRDRRAALLRQSRSRT